MCYISFFLHIYIFRVCLVCSTIPRLLLISGSPQRVDWCIDLMARGRGTATFRARGLGQSAHQEAWSDPGGAAVLVGGVRVTGRCEDNFLDLRRSKIVQECWSILELNMGWFCEISGIILLDVRRWKKPIHVQFQNTTNTTSLGCFQPEPLNPMVWLGDPSMRCPEFRMSWILDKNQWPWDISERLKSLVVFWPFPQYRCLVIQELYV